MAGMEYGSGCQGCLGSRGCCSHCDLRIFQIHLERKEGVRPGLSVGGS